MDYIIADASLPAGHCFVVGPTGDDEPGALLDRMQFVNTGGVELRLGHTLTGVLGTRFSVVPANSSRLVYGASENLVVYNPHGSTAGAWSLDASATERNGGHRGAADVPFSKLRTRVVRFAPVAGETKERVVRFARKAHLRRISLYSVAVPSGATLEFSATTQVGDSVIAAAFNLETLVTKTLTPMTMTATLGRLQFEPQSELRLAFSSSNGADTPGDLLAEVVYTDDQ